MSGGWSAVPTDTGYPTIPGIAKYLPWRYTTRHLAASLHPAEDLRNPQEARGVHVRGWYGDSQVVVS